MKKHQTSLSLKLRSAAMIKSVFTLLFFLIASFVQAQTTMPKVFSDHMVLQRDIHIPVWGKANPGTKIKVTLAGYTSTSFADDEGQWMVRLPKLKAGGPFTLNIFEAQKPGPVLTFKDVLIGDVYVASGQSNMEWQVQQAMNANEEIKNVNYPNIRLFNVPHNKTIAPQEDLRDGKWAVCDTSSVKSVSAVAYYFARELNKNLEVPIGILQSTWGGTPVEAWTSREMLLSSPLTRNNVLGFDTITPSHFVKDSLDLIRFWDIVYNPQNNSEQTYSEPDLDDSQWAKIKMPTTLKNMDMPAYEGMVWLRRNIIIPESMTNRELTINLGHPEMNYSLFFNGKEVCKNIWNANLPHEYVLPDSLIEEGENTIAVRMAFLWGGGGFNPPAEEMYLTDGNINISLTGAWKYQKDLEPEIPFIQNYHQYPSYLFNAMIAPVIPFGIRGFIWYQGENNVEQAYDYRTLFPMMIADWRIRWQQEYLPFLFVQLANYMERDSVPTESNWALLRESQTKTLNHPNTGMACVIDIGDANTIHPLNKQEVGRRLALIARNRIYREQIQASGPVFEDFEIENSQIRIHFSEIGSGLSIRNEKEIKGFSIAGKDQQFYWAEAEINGNEVIVQADEVSNPVAVRYAWANNPDCNLINKEGLPAVPFRTDHWPATE
ncbi:sialate O-acetylesterase [Marinilabilia sp.]|uniref:sialate O-acetylesterase n=1 Tax=Marinilabilia sp. TaxID=2021252 RepID=UPI0025C09E4D|nr:sialate O-acetylesterase [Marinilabilia sp.]